MRETASRSNVLCAKLQSREYKGCINGKTDTILLQWPLCSLTQSSVEGFPVILNVQPPHKPPFKEAGSVLNNPSWERKPKAPTQASGAEAQPVGVGRLRLWRQRGRSGKGAGASGDRPGSTCLEETQARRLGCSEKTAQKPREKERHTRGKRKREVSYRREQTVSQETE